MQVVCVKTGFLTLGAMVNVFMMIFLNYKQLTVSKHFKLSRIFLQAIEINKLGLLKTSKSCTI